MVVVVVDLLGFTIPYDIELCEALGKICESVYLLTSDNVFEVKGEKFRFIKYRSLFDKKYKKFKLLNLNKVLSFIDYLIKLIKITRDIFRLKPQIVHFQWIVFPLIDMLFIFFYKKRFKLILTLHDTVPFNNSPSSKLQKLGYYFILNFFENIIVHTQQSKENLVKIVPKIEKKVNIIPHCFLYKVNEVKFFELSKRTDGIKSILFWGTIKPYKGLDILIRAYAKLPVYLRDITELIICGKPFMDMSGIFSLINQLGIREKVKFHLDFVSEEYLNKLLEEAYLIVLPYRHIDASGVFMRSIVYSKPVIASNIGIFMEFLEDLRDFLLFEPEDYVDLSHKIFKLIVDENLYKMVSKSISYKLKNYITWDDVARMTFQLYNKSVATEN